MFLCSLFYMFFFFFAFLSEQRAPDTQKFSFLLALTQIADRCIVIKVYPMKKVLPLFEVFKKIY